MIQLPSLSARATRRQVNKTGQFNLLTDVSGATVFFPVTQTSLLFDRVRCTMPVPWLTTRMEPAVSKTIPRAPVKPLRISFDVLPGAMAAGNSDVALRHGWPRVPGTVAIASRMILMMRKELIFEHLIAGLLVGIVNEVRMFSQQG